MKAPGGQCEICGQPCKNLTCSKACAAIRRRTYHRAYNREHYSDPKKPPREKREEKDG